MRNSTLWMPSASLAVAATATPPDVLTLAPAVGDVIATTGGVLLASADGTPNVAGRMAARAAAPARTCRRDSAVTRVARATPRGMRT
jgi:hypothetical protein